MVNSAVSGLDRSIEERLLLLLFLLFLFYQAAAALLLPLQVQGQRIDEQRSDLHVHLAVQPPPPHLFPLSSLPSRYGG